jgi:hypothetical protein
MKITDVYSHLNGEEYLLVKQPNLYQEIKDVIKQVDAAKCMTKRSKEKTMKGKCLYSPKALNRQFKSFFRQKGWSESRYSYYVTTNRKYMEEMLPVKAMAKDPHGGRLLSTGIAYFEGEVYNILRHGRSSPPVPLLILGIAP